ncbi:MAG: hypothetical protein K2W82_09150 [Candidatus Obscuribacterales bacterium]|nr:hypothetical protein [Candidatus Obscuribacterales bacterium]
MPTELIDIRLYAPMATVTASSIATFLWWLAKQRKRLSICVMRSEPLIAMRGTARRKLKVMFGDKPLQSAYLLHISILNDGNQPIAKSDYQSPVRIELNADAKICEADVIETWPADMDRTLSSDVTVNLIKTVSDSWLELEPVLLNSRDEIVLQLLVENYDNHLTVSQRITGIKRVDQWKESRFIPMFITFLGICVSIFAAFFVEPDQPYNLALPSLPYMILVSIGALMLTTGIAWPHSERSRQFLQPKNFATERQNKKTKVSMEGI